MKNRYYLITCYNHMWWALLSKLIRWVDGKDSSHCEILVVNEFDEYFFYGSLWPKSRRATLEEFKKHYDIKHLVRIYPVKKVNDKDAVEYLESNLNKYYSFVQILFAFFKIIFKSFTSVFNDINVNATKYLICTELCGNFMRDKCGFKFSTSTDLLTISELKRKAKIK